MQLSVCVTTINAVDALNSCLEALWNSTAPPSHVVVSDDSSNWKIQQQNRQIVERYPNTDYVSGPCLGVCANRNCALKNLPPCDFIAFIDDDICVEPDYFANALSRYRSLSSETRQQTFLTGGIPHKLSFRGYFCPSDLPLCVNLHTAVFPASFFARQQWDENIFFGFEDALLCLQALQQGYSILHCPELKVRDTRSGKSTLGKGGFGRITQYQIYIEAARLYIGIKRYREIEPDRLKLIFFLIIYFLHMNLYLSRKQALRAWPNILRLSRITKLFN
jgi:GT2 family glycosyltransferase